ncbi:UDP-glucose 4-epimerase family protein [Metapseudomonas otitidis]|uniref:UDP-glucose 4-epimerase family protein n=1 Tax=Metapseudomonas otitidis TaxID=319939 RepID=UPI0013F59D89|nr:SDR family oxidoreductase [Pseudomonas otitidis]
MSLILLTGASGFVGKALHAALTEKKLPVLTAGRSQAGLNSLVFDSIDGDTDWAPALANVSCVIHSAGRAHITRDFSKDPLSEFRKINVCGTLNLARQSAKYGVSRFIFISSAKVNGDSSLDGHPFNAEQPPAPVDAYSLSKLEAERGLHELARQTGMQVVIIRPVLVYGPGVKANFLSMMNWLARGIPLPLGAVDNKRSFVALDNLVDLITVCIDHPAAANQVFMVSDDDDISTSELLRRLGKALEVPARLLPVPTWALRSVAMMVGKYETAQRLCGSLQVDISKTKSLLGWVPPVTLDVALKCTARHFLEQRR